MADIPLSARVECAGSTCGRSTHAVINPATQQVTHFVVKEKGRHHTERLVPVDLVAETTPDLISSEISRIGERAVYLRLDKHRAESLPAVPVKWH